MIYHIINMVNLLISFIVGFKMIFLLPSAKEVIKDAAKLERTGDVAYETLVGTHPFILLEESIKLKRALAKGSDDESIRWQLWNFAESIKNHTSSIYYGVALQTLKLGIDAYDRLQRKIRSDLAFAHEPLLSLKKIDYATSFEKRVGLPPLTKSKEKCGFTARAVMEYFVRKKLVHGDIRKFFERPNQGIDALKSALKSDTSKLVWVDSVRLDHVFIIHQQGPNNFRIYQSFVNHFSLEAELARSIPMTRQSLNSFLNKLEVVLNGENWDERIDENFIDLFHARPSSRTIKTYNRLPTDLEVITVPLI